MTVAKPHIDTGQRVRCEKVGAFQGLVGEVEDIWNGQALVYLDQGTAITEPIDCFEPLHSNGSQSQSSENTGEFTPIESIEQ